MQTTYVIDLGTLGDQTFNVDYTCYMGTPDTRWEPGEPASCEINSATAVDPKFNALNELICDYLNDEGNSDFGDAYWPDEEAAKADYYYQLYKDRKIDDHDES